MELEVKGRKKCRQTQTNLRGLPTYSELGKKNENGNMLASSHSILKGWKIWFGQLVFYEFRRAELCAAKADAATIYAYEESVPV
jgi:hypothetical protein